MLSKQRLTFLALVLQASALILISQTWYSISMSPEGHTVVLGDYSGADANPSAMATSGFSAVAILVLAFSQRLALRIAAALALIANVVLGFAVALGLANRNISALDTELDRLTGIAGTHGIKGLTIVQNSTGWVWLVIEIVLVLSLAYAAIVAPTAVRALKPSKSGKGKNTTSKAKAAATTIDLWDDQRR